MVTRARRWRAAGLAIAAGLLAPAPVIAGVVVSASGPSAASFPIGRKIGDSERIVLRAGDSLTVLDGKGTRVLRGAGTYSLDQQAGPARTNAFAALTERRAARRVTAGAVRGDEVVSLSPPNLWYVDVTRPGTMCLADTERVRLWRGAAEGEVTYTIRSANGGQTVAFSDGAILAPWDQQALPVAEGTEYQVSGGGADREAALRFVLLPSVADDPEALAAQLIEHGCTRQLELLASATMIEG